MFCLDSCSFSECNGCLTSGSELKEKESQRYETTHQIHSEEQENTMLGGEKGGPSRKLGSHWLGHHHLAPLRLLEIEREEMESGSQP